MDARDTINSIDVFEFNNLIEAELSEITAVDSFINSILKEDNFEALNTLTLNRRENVNNLFQSQFNFISTDIDSLNNDLITEREFFEIVECSENRVYKRAGRYQEMLYGHYMQAKREEDQGYIRDVLNKAIALKNNIIEVKMLMKNKRYMKEWRKNIGDISPLEELKNSGDMRKLNLIKDLF